MDTSQQVANGRVVPSRRRWWERIAQAFVIETELADGCRVLLPLDASGMSTYWPMAPALDAESTHAGASTERRSTRPDREPIAALR